MALSLLIETATPDCSIAVAKNGQLLEDLTAPAEQSHNTLAAKYAKKLLDQYKKKGSLAFVAISIGPGSYTGLRIGLSLAKGICFAQNIPLITVCTLQSIAFGMRERIKNTHKKPLKADAQFISLIDARRMEAYVGIFNTKLKSTQKIAAKILDDAFLESINSENTIYVGGNCVEKAKKVLSGSNVQFVEGLTMSASHLMQKAYKKYKQKSFANLAYTTPVYLKQFRAGKPKKLL